MRIVNISRLHVAAFVMALISLAVVTSHADILYVTTLGNTIDKITSDGVVSVFASSGLNNPRGLAFDSAGNLYVANNGSNTVEKSGAARSRRPIS